jgi:hypothetical protein
MQYLCHTLQGFLKFRIILHGAYSCTFTSKEDVPLNCIALKNPSFLAGFQPANFRSSGKHANMYAFRLILYTLKPAKYAHKSVTIKRMSSFKCLVFRTSWILISSERPLYLLTTFVVLISHSNNIKEKYFKLSRDL